MPAPPLPSRYAVAFLALILLDSVTSLLSRTPGRGDQAVIANLALIASVVVLAVSARRRIEPRLPVLAAALIEALSPAMSHLHLRFSGASSHDVFVATNLILFCLSFGGLAWAGPAESGPRAFLSRLAMLWIPLSFIVLRAITASLVETWVRSTASALLDINQKVASLGLLLSLAAFLHSISPWQRLRSAVGFFLSMATLAAVVTTRF